MSDIDSQLQRVRRGDAPQFPAEKVALYLAAFLGEVAGPVLKPLAIRAVCQTAKELPGIPLIGVGGIQSVRDVQEFLDAGAAAVQIDTAIWRDPEVVFALTKP